MRRAISSVILCCTLLPAFGTSAEWLTDAQAAQEKAKRENKLVLLDFTGSDWCGWCMKLKSEVFDQPGFAEFAQANLVLVEVDFPHHKLMPREQKMANNRLANAYGVTGYPTLIILDQSGSKVGKLGYVAGGLPAFIRKLEAVAKPPRQPAQSQSASTVDAASPRTPVSYTLPPSAVPIKYGPLTLKSVSGPKERRMVLINNASMMTGETAKVRALDKEIVVVCKEIREDSILITADGKPMELKLTQR